MVQYNIAKFATLKQWLLYYSTLTVDVLYSRLVQSLSCVAILYGFKETTEISIKIIEIA